MINSAKSPLFNVSLFSLFWALQILVSKLAFISGAHPVTFTLQAATVALVVLGLAFLPHYWRQLARLPRSVWGSLLLANAIHFGLGGFFSNSGMALTSAINAGFLVKFALVTTILLAWIFLREALTHTKILVVAMMILGGYLISTKGQSLVPQLGDVLIILACLSWSTGNILVKKALNQQAVSGDLISLLRPVSGIPVLLLFVWLSPLYPGAVQSVFQINYGDWSLFWHILGSGIFTALLWTFLNRTLQVATASYMTMMSMMTPVLVSALAVWLLREQLLWVQVFGGALTIVAGIITHYSGENSKGRVA